MDNIIEPTETFDFSNLSLAHPTGIQGGAYFTKIQYNNKPLYIQTTKSLTKQGFVKSGKKYYSDLMFDKNSETLINWFENLENKCQKLIFEKRDSWFQNNLEETDIETAFNSIIRVYKSGKYYLVRVNVKNNHNNLPAIKIYNEKEIPLNIDDIKNDTEVISILEIQGIKFTSRNFQIEIEIKQVMVLDNEPLFDNCLIKPKKRKDINETLQVLDELERNDILEENIDNDRNNNDKNNNDNDNNDNDYDDDNKLNIDNDGNNNLDNIHETLENLEPIDIINESQTLLENNKKDDNIILDFEELKEDFEENQDELKELNNLDLKLDSLETIQLKKPNQVYFELYKEARKKAKIAKKNALIAYLEAKNIKKTYMIEENINDSDSDIDAEIDDVSESELEGL